MRLFLLICFFVIGSVKAGWGEDTHQHRHRHHFSTHKFHHTRHFTHHRNAPNCMAECTDKMIPMKLENFKRCLRIGQLRESCSTIAYNILTEMEKSRNSKKNTADTDADDSEDESSDEEEESADDDENTEDDTPDKKTDAATDMESGENETLKEVRAFFKSLPVGVQHLLQKLMIDHATIGSQVKEWEKGQLKYKEELFKLAKMEGNFTPKQYLTYRDNLILQAQKAFSPVFLMRFLTRCYEKFEKMGAKILNPQLIHLGQSAPYIAELYFINPKLAIALGQVVHVGEGGDQDNLGVPVVVPHHFDLTEQTYIDYGQLFIAVNESAVAESGQFENWLQAKSFYTLSLNRAL